MKTKKTFNCVEMKRRGAKIIHNQIATLTPKEQLIFWQKRNELLKKRQKKIKRRAQMTQTP